MGIGETTQLLKLTFTRQKREQYCTLVAQLAPPCAAQPLIMTQITAWVALPLTFPPAVATHSVFG